MKLRHIKTDQGLAARNIAHEEARERLRRDALAAWTEYRATGRHVAADEADAWLKRLEAGKNAKPPPRGARFTRSGGA